MANTVKMKRSAVAAKVPTTSDLALGEIAINTYDGKVYIKKDNGTASIVEVGATATVADGSITTAKLGGDITTAGKALLDDADAAAQRTTLGLGTANSPTFAGLTLTGAGVLAAGTVTAPTLAPTGDSNTGLWFPAADTVAMSTGGSERLRINSTGQLGLGVTPTAELDVNGNYAANIVAMAALDVDCSAGNYFTKTISGNSTFTFSNAPASRSFSFTLELTHTSGTVTWPTAVKWPGDTAPTLTTGKTHLFMFVTDDGGTRWRGASLVNYTN